MTSRTGDRPAATTTEERAAAQAEKLAALHVRLQKQIAALTSGADWQAWLRVAARFHHYSFNNVLLIAAQRPDATHVAGYRTWQSLGRQVARGEHGIQILAPVTRRTDSDPPDQDMREDTSEKRADPAAGTAGRRLVGYRVAHVWDITQTSGDPLPEQPAPRLLRGRGPDTVWSALQARVKAAGFTVERGDCGAANGYTDFAARAVRVRDDVSDAQACKTLAHEVGHVLLHNPGHQAADTRGCRGVQEVEAESVAYLVCTSAGLDTGDYTFPYIASWATHSDADDPVTVVAASGQRVLATANTILDELHPATAADGPPPHLIDRAQALRVAARPIAAARPLAVEPAAARLREAHAAAAAWYRDQLLGADGAAPRRYLDQRALGCVLDPDDPWQVGYAPPQWRGLTQHLRDADFTEIDLEAAGLATRSRSGTLIDRFRDRIMLPVRTSDGAIVAFIGRAPDGRNPRTPKYLNSPTTRLYRKGVHLFGVGAQPLHGRRVVVVEGPFDALALHAVLRAVTAVAPGGTAFTDAHAVLLAHAGVRDLVVAFDGDQAGAAAAAKAHGAVHEHFSAALAARLPAGEDPASLLQTHPAELVSRLTDPANLVPLADLVVDHEVSEWRRETTSPEGRLAAARHFAPVIADLPAHQVAREVTRAATALGIPFDTLTAALADQAGSAGRSRLPPLSHHPPATATLRRTITSAVTTPAQPRR